MDLMKTKVRQLLEEGRVDAFIAYKTVHGLPFPTVFTKADVDTLETWQPFKARYPVTKLLLAKARQNPDKTFGVLVRGCEERSLYELFKWNQLDPDKIVVLGQACPRIWLSIANAPNLTRITWTTAKPPNPSSKVGDFRNWKP